jgi:uncharacterized protein YgiM (DUF1202 family)
MRRLALLLIFIQNAVIPMAYADTSVQVVKVADPFLEMHTGPSPGYPITNVVKRDETISILKRRTTWYLIKNNKDFEGWVHRSQLVKTLTLDDEKIAIKDITRDEYLEHEWEMSMIGGSFGDLPMMTLSGGYALTKNLSTEAAFTQIIGDFSSRQLLGINLINQPFPDWKISPYFSLGGGIISTRVKSTLSQLEDDTDFTANVSLGLKMYLTRSFLVRTDLKKHIIFQSRDKNEEITSWQVGFAVFF